jgi:hypothetical protein
MSIYIYMYVREEGRGGGGERGREGEREREPRGEPYLVQVLQSQGDFSDVEPGVALGEGPHLMQVSEHLPTTHIVCAQRKSTMYQSIG